jgi:26S proteasome regulatory subunit N7
MVAAPATAAEDAEVKQDFRLDLANKRFLYRANDIEGVDRAALQRDILDVIVKEEMAPAYEGICEELGWDVDTAKLEALRKANQQRLEQLDAAIKDAEANLGDVEVREARAAKADYLCKIGDRAAAVEAYKKVEETAAGSGLKMDNVFTMLRGDLAAGSWAEVKQGIARAKELCSAGGDWERKNRLKVYEAFFLMATRNFKAAATLFLEAIATFTTTELFSFERCIFYTVITSLVSLDRMTLKTKVIDAPEVLTIIDSMPELSQFLNSLYNCQYHEFFKAFVNVAADVQQDFALAPHFRYYIREVRVVAYSQFLESYKSVKLGSMAAAFGVGPDFMDQELAGFIAAGRLPAKIDKVAGVVETSRLDLKNQQYQQAIKQGDLVLNRLQKLAKVADVE